MARGYITNVFVTFQLTSDELSHLLGENKDEEEKQPMVAWFS